MGEYDNPIGTRTSSGVTVKILTDEELAALPVDEGRKAELIMDLESIDKRVDLEKLAEVSHISKNREELFRQHMHFLNTPIEDTFGLPRGSLYHATTEQIKRESQGEEE